MGTLEIPFEFQVMLQKNIQTGRKRLQQVLDEALGFRKDFKHLLQDRPDIQKSFQGIRWGMCQEFNKVQELFLKALSNFQPKEENYDYGAKN